MKLLRAETTTGTHKGEGSRRPGSEKEGIREKLIGELLCSLQNPLKVTLSQGQFSPLLCTLSLLLSLPLTNSDIGPLCKHALLFTVSSRMEGSKSCTALV